MYIRALILFALSLISAQTYAQDMGGSYATRAYIAATEERALSIGQKLAEQGILIDGKIPQSTDFLKYGLDMEENQTVWELTGGGPVLNSMGISLKQFFESTVIRSIQGLLFFIIGVIITLGAYNRGTLFSEMQQWAIKLVAIFFVMFMPQFIYGFVMLASSTLTQGIGSVFFNTQIGSSIQERMAITSPELSDLARTYRKSYDRAINHNQVFFSHTSPQAHNLIIEQLNALSEELSNAGYMDPKPKLELLDNNLALSQENAFARYREISQALINKVPAQVNGSRLILQSLNGPFANYQEPNSSNFNPFIMRPANISSASSPWAFLKTYDPVLTALHRGEYNPPNNRRSRTVKLSESDKKEMKKHFSTSIYETSMAYFDRTLWDRIQAIAQARGLNSAADTLQEQKSARGALAVDRPLSKRIADKIYSFVGTLSYYYVKILCSVMTWGFGALTELSLFGMFIMAPLWLWNRTEQAFTGLVGIFITSNLYPMVMLFSIAVMDAIFALATNIVLGSTAGLISGATALTGVGASYGSTLGLGKLIGLATGGSGLLLGAGLFAVAGGIAVLLGLIILTLFYCVAITVVVLKTPAITRKILSGQLPLAEFAQSTIAGLVSASTVGTGMVRSSNLATNSEKALTNAKSTAKTLASNTQTGLARQAEKYASSSSPLGRMARRYQREFSSDSPLSESKWSTRNAMSALKNMGSGLSKASSSEGAKSVAQLGGSVLRESASMVMAGGNLSKYQNLRTISKSQVTNQEPDNSIKKIIP